MILAIICRPAVSVNFQLGNTVCWTQFCMLSSVI